MGSECYRHCRLKDGVEITEKDEIIYQEVLSSIIKDTKGWLLDEDSDELIAVFDGENALELNFKNDHLFKGRIIVPKKLDHSLDICWAHRSIIVDPISQLMKLETKL